MDEMGKHVKLWGDFVPGDLEHIESVGRCSMEGVHELHTLLGQNKRSLGLNPKGLPVYTGKKRVDVAKAHTYCFCVDLMLLQIGQNACILVLQIFRQDCGVIAFEPPPQIALKPLRTENSYIKDPYKEQRRNHNAFTFHAPKYPAGKSACVEMAKSSAVKWTI